MFLDDMDVGDLNRLRARLDTVAAAMFKLSDGGLKPRLSMLPGDEVLIILTNLLPGESEIGAIDLEPSPLRAQIDRVRAERGLAPGEPLMRPAERETCSGKTFDEVLARHYKGEDTGPEMIPIIIEDGLPVEAAEEAVTLPQAPAVVDVGPKLPEAASLPAAAKKRARIRAKRLGQA